MFSNIVVGTDGSDTAALALTVAVDVAAAHGALLHVVHASKASRGEAGRGDSEKLLTEVTRTITDASVTTRAVAGSSADVVVTMAEEVGADLILVGSKGMRGRQRSHRSR